MSSAEVGSSSTTNLRLEHHGAGNGDALALAAGKLVRIARQRARRRARLRRAPRATFARRARRRSVSGMWTQQALADDVADGHARRQRAEGVLEDDLHVACAAAASARQRAVCDVGADESRCARSTTSAAAAPARASSCPSRIRRRRPASARRAPRASTSSTALTWPTVRRSSPRLIGNQTFSPAASTRAGASGSASGGAPFGSAARSCLV